MSLAPPGEHTTAPGKHTFCCRFRVRSYELDSFGHVNNAVYLQYLEAARGDSLLQAGFSFNDFERWGAYPVVRRAELEYRGTLRSDDEIEITTTMEPLRRTGFRATQTIARLTGPSPSVVLDAALDLVFTDRSGRPIVVPPAFREQVLE